MTKKQNIEIPYKITGNTSPRFIRATTYNIATTGELMASSKIPVGLIVQPLNELRASEQPIEVVDMGERGPIRCNRCKAYINPFVRWSHGGQKFICNICDLANDVPAEYFANLDMSGRRVDLMQRPELRYGTVEFVATKEFCARPPTPASFVFLIDVSWNAIQSGMLQVATQTIKEMLDLFPMQDDQACSPCRVAIVTYDRSVHFYNLNVRA